MPRSHSRKRVRYTLSHWHEDGYARIGEGDTIAVDAQRGIVKVIKRV